MGREEKMDELGSSYNDRGELAVSCAVREIQSCVYPTVLCFLHMSFCLSAKLFHCFNEFGDFSDAIWGEEVTFLTFLLPINHQCDPTNGSQK